MGNYFEERLYPEQPFRTEQKKQVTNYIISRQEIQTKVLHAMIIRVFKEHYQDYQEEINGKQHPELS